MSDTRIRVLIGEEDPQLGGLLETFLSGRGCAPVLVRDGRTALERLLSEPFDVAILDIVMPELDGLAVLRQLREEPLPPEVIISSGIGTVDTAIAAIKLGAYDYLPKPYRMTEIEALVRRAFEKRLLVRADALRRRRRATPLGLGEFRTSTPELLAVLSLVEPLAPTVEPVCVLGERGTGKLLVARALHRMSGRTGPFVEMRCGDVQPARHEAELVGQDAADPAARRLGAMELAAGGTLFLADIERLEPRAQLRLLTLLDEGIFVRAEGHRVRHADVRIVVATSLALADATVARTMRADLAARLGARVIALPPLRHRRGDIRLLAEKFLAETGGMNPPRLTEPAAEALEVTIEAPDLCPRFSARVLDVRLGPSPAWIRDRLEAVGVRPIHNVVDLTNYVMMEMGHPSHAFDQALIPEGRLRVRWAREGEALETLDGADDPAMTAELVNRCDRQGRLRQTEGNSPQTVSLAADWFTTGELDEPVVPRDLDRMANRDLP